MFTTTVLYISHAGGLQLLLHALQLPSAMQQGETPTLSLPAGAAVNTDTTRAEARQGPFIYGCSTWLHGTVREHCGHEMRSMPVGLSKSSKRGSERVRHLVRTQVPYLVLAAQKNLFRLEAHGAGTTWHTYEVCTIHSMLNIVDNIHRKKKPHRRAQQ